LFVVFPLFNGGCPSQIAHPGLVKNLLGITLEMQLHPHDLVTSLNVLNELHVVIDEDDDKPDADQVSESIPVSA
jgi:hypothetical protein